MDVNNTLIKLMKNDDQDSESGQSDFVPAKSTNKVIKSFIKCVGALVLHIENVLSNSNGHFITYNSPHMNHDNDIDIVEHAIKEDPDDASRYLKSIKKSVLQLCLLCVEQNIYVHYDLKFYKIDYYSCLDDSTRSLVINYLTENVGYMIEHIGFIVSMFTQEKYLEEARDIRKSLQKIHKQILLIPLNSNLDETPKVYQNLNSSQWYSESVQSLGEKLSQLRTTLIKFKKIFKKKIYEQDYSTEDGSIFNISSPGKRKISNISDEPTAKRLKLERNEGTSLDHEFLVPQIPPVQKNHPENEINDVRAKKNSEKQKKKYEINENNIGSDTESVKKKKKLKINSKNSDSETIIILENDTEHLKKKKKHKSKLENSDNDSKFSESNSEIIEKKNKHESKSKNIENNSGNVKNKSGNYENESIKRSKSKNNSDNETDSENIKNKSKTESKNDANDLIIIENKSEGIKKKKKRKSKLEDEVNPNISENVKNKPNTEPENSENDLIILENDSGNIKKKNKRRSKSENKENNSVDKKNVSENVKNKSNIEPEYGVNDLIILENDSEDIKKNKRRSKSKNRENNSVVDKSISEVKNKSKTEAENNSIILVSDSENIKKKKKRKSKSEHQDNDSVVNKNVSENIKHKSNIEAENDLILLVSDSENIKKKNKRRSKSVNKEIDSVVNTENIKNKSNIEAENTENDLIILENNSEIIKKENKRRSKSEIDTVVNKSISENVKNKSRTEEECDVNDLVIIENESERIKKKKRRRSKSENNENNSKKEAEDVENDSIILESDSENITKKIKHRSKSENRENNVNKSISENVKNKSKAESVNDENDLIILENDSENIKKKNKHRSKSENNSVINKSISENINNKSKAEAENGENDSILLDSDSENITKKYKHRSKSENMENNSVINKSISENVNKSKAEAENDSIILDSDYENITKKNMHKSKSGNTENDSVLCENDSENTEKKKNHESKCSEISAGELFSNSDNNKENSHKVMKTKKKSRKLSDEDDSDDIFGAIYRRAMETSEVGNSEDFLQLLAREENLSQEEKFLYIQELLLEAKENNELSPKMKEKLKNLTVLIDWEVPPIHKVEKKLTAGPSANEKEILNSLGVINKQYNRDEDDTIRNNWENFCKLHDLDANPKPFLIFKHGKKAFLNYEERKKFVQFLGKGLANRALHSIYRRFKVLFRDKNKLGRFTPQEDELILTYCNHAKDDKHKFADLANVLNRNRPAIEVRYRNLTRCHRERVYWNIKLDTKLINELLKAIKSKNVEDLRTAKLTVVQYKKVGDEMKMYWEKVRFHWLKCTCTKLFSSIPLHLGKIRLKIVQILIDSGVTDWKKIDWQDVESHFEGVTKEFLMLQFSAVQIMAPKILRSDLGAVLQHAEVYLDTVRDKEHAFGKITLKRYKMLKDGSIESYE